MAEPTPDTIGFWISRDASNSTFRPLLDTTIEVLKAHLSGRSQEECADLAERLLTKIIESLARISADSLEDGVEPTFELSTEQTTAYFRTIESPAALLIDRLIGRSPTEFEGFCAEVLRRMGGIPKVTGRSGDGGIDFVARDLPLSLGQGPSPLGARLLVLGQAKRYSRDHLVIESELRSFVGGAIRKVSDPEDNLTFRKAVLAPVTFAFWTTSDFQPSAKKYARSVGLWYLGGIGLAQLAIRLGMSLD